MRLFQGDYAKVTVFSDKPAEMARQWVEQGASYLHLVDLDGAALGRSENLAAVEEIMGAVPVPCELGGGLRDIESIATLISMGIDRVILGTLALENPLLVAEACQLWPGRIVVGIDARKGMVATRGWKQLTHVKALDLAREMVGYGVARIIYTDIERDGTLTQPNYEETTEMVKGVDVPVIASGGVASLEHIEGLLPSGAEAVIVGRALYDGKLDLKEAIRVAEGREV